MNSKSYTLGIDFGTTSLSLVLVDSKTREVIKQLSNIHNAYITYPENWRKEQDLSIIGKCLIDSLDQMLFFVDGNIDSIGLTGQQHGIIGLDIDGKAITNLVTWQDESTLVIQSDGQSIIGQMEKLNPDLIVFAGYGLATLYKWVNIDKIAEIVRFTDVADYFGRMLTLNFGSNLMHPSMAHSMGAFDVFTDSWDISGIQKLNLELQLFPEIQALPGQIGFASFSNKNKQTQVYTAIGDNQASFMGTVGDAKKAMLINIGTGAQISVAIDRKTAAKIKINNPNTEIRPFLGNTFLLSTNFINGGGVYKSLHDFFELCATQLFGLKVGEVRNTLWQDMERIANEYNGSDAMNVFPMFNGTRSNPKLRGSIGNIGTNNFTPDNLIYSTLRGMAEMYKNAIPQKVLKQVHVIYGSGNGIKHNVLMRHLLSEVFERDVVVNDFNEEAALGVALMIKAQF